MTGDFGIVYKGYLIKSHGGAGETFDEYLAVKTLKGEVAMCLTVNHCRYISRVETIFVEFCRLSYNVLPSFTFRQYTRDSGTVT